MIGPNDIPPPHLMLKRKTRLDIVREIELPTVGIGGHIHSIELIDAASGLIVQKLGPFPNLITNVGLDMFATHVAHFTDYRGFGAWGQPNTSGLYMGLGTGSTAPANTDSTLVSELADPTTNRSRANNSIAITTGYVAGPPDYHWMRRTYFFTESQGNGNLTEVGLFNALTGGSMMIRQLLKDGGGVPTTVVKTAAQQLRVVWEGRMYPPTADIDQPAENVDLYTVPTAHDIKIRPANANSAGHWGLFSWPRWNLIEGRAFTGAIGVRTGAPSGTQTIGSSGGQNAYVAANYYRDWTGIWEPATGTHSIRCITFGSAGAPPFDGGGNNWQIEFTPAVAKTDLDRFTVVARYSWNRV